MTEGPSGPGGRSRGAGSVLLWTVLGTLVPGLGLIVAGWRKLGGIVLVLTVAASVALAVRVGSDPFGALADALGPGVLTGIVIALLAVGLAWAVLVVCTYRALRPPVDSTAHRAVMAVVVGVLCLLVLAPTSYAAGLGYTTRSTVHQIFADAPSATVPTRAPDVRAAEPWRDKPRLNVLLLGSDAGPTAGGGIRSGLRTDSVVVASIDTHTGNTVLISVARNTERLQFQPGTPLAEAYPDGYVSTDPSEQNLLNSIYDDLPAAHPGLLGKTANEGADALKEGLGYSLFGSADAIDYYVLVSLTGFQEVVNALGGVTVNVNEPVAVGGDHEPGQTDVLPTRWIMPGPHQHLSGHDVEWFSRGRYNATDYQRIRRQRCTINAVVNQASPVKLLESYNSLASTAADVTRTDIPQSVLPALLQLGNTVKADGTLSSLPVDQVGIAGFDQFHPEWDRVRGLVRQALGESNARATSRPGPTAAAAATSRPTATGTPTATGSPAATGNSAIAPDLNETCAYNAGLAGQNLDQWRTQFGSRYRDDGTRR